MSRSTTVALTTLGVLGCIFLVAPLATIFQRLLSLPHASLSAVQWILLSSADSLPLLVHSFALAGCVGIIVTLCSIPLVCILGGPPTRFSRVLGKFLFIPLLLPPFVGTLGLRQILSRFGTVNLVLLDSGLLDTPVDLLGGDGFFGIILIQSLHFLPLMVLFLVAGIKQLDLSLIEAAWCCGGTRMSIFFKIILPLLLPAFLGAALLIVMGSVADIGTPLLFNHRGVISVRIFDSLTGEAEDPAGYILSLLLGGVGVILFPLFAFGLGQNLSSDGRTGRPLTVHSLHPAVRRLLSTASLLLMAAMLSPHLGVILLAIADEWILSPLPSSLTTSHLLHALRHPLAYRSIIISLALATVCSLVTLIVGFTISWSRERYPTLLSRLIELGSYLPLTIPGLVFAFGYLLFFSGTFLDPRVNPVPLLVIAYAVRKLPYMVKACSSGMKLVPRVFEESALLVGASRLRVFFSVSIPLIRDHLIAGVVICFCSSMLEVSDSLMLAREERFYPVSKALYALAARPDGPALSCALALHVMILSGMIFGIAALLGRKNQGLPSRDSQ